MFFVKALNILNDRKRLVLLADEADGPRVKTTVTTLRCILSDFILVLAFSAVTIHTFVALSVKHFGTLRFFVLHV